MPLRGMNENDKCAKHTLKQAFDRLLHSKMPPIRAILVRKF